MSIENRAITQAVALLTASGCEFAIITKTGQKFGTLEVAPPKSQKRAAVRNVGIVAYIRSILNNVEVGQLAEIPCKDWDIDALRASVTATASNMWGKGSYISEVSGGVVRLIRSC